MAALKTVFDPEIPVNIWELGLIYDVFVDADGVAAIRMTLTAPACPAAQILPGQVRDAAQDRRRRHRREGRRRLGAGLDQGPDVGRRQAATGDVVMLRLSKKADYALMAMKHLAIKSDSAPSSTSAREIAEQYDIPIELMAKVLQRLARSGLLTSHQGTRGGYTLSRPDRVDLGRRHHPGDRRPADRHRLLDRGRERASSSRSATSAIRSGGSRIASWRRCRPARCAEITTETPYQAPEACRVAPLALTVTSGR